jgi:hypothetical protein
MNGHTRGSTKATPNAAKPSSPGYTPTITVSLQVAGLGLAGRVSGGRLALGCDSYNHSPQWVRFGGLVRRRGGRPTLTRLHLGDLIRRLPVSAEGRIVALHSAAPK